MRENHGGPVTLKSIGEIAKFIKNLIPANIPEAYALKPIFKNVASEDDIRNGVIAYRDFLYVFCDRLISDGHFKPPNKPKSAADYPFLYAITDLLTDMGYHGKLTESGMLLVTQLPSFTAPKAKNSVAKLIECLRFLTLCGFTFTGIDLDAKTLNISEMQPLEVSYPTAPILLTGLKALSIADIDLRTKRYMSDNNHDNLLRCDYRLLKAEDTDVTDILNDFVHPLPEKVQNFALELHQRYIDMGMTCAAIVSTFDVHFAYAHIKNSRRVLSPKDISQLRVWEFALSVKDGYSLIIKSKKTDKYADVINKFHPSLREIIARGYGCDRKLHNEPCQKGCQGIRLPLDNSILNISGDIKTWLDNEISC